MTHSPEIKGKIAHLAKDEDEEIVLSHLLDLSRRSYERGRLEVSAFLGESLSESAERLLCDFAEGEYLLWGGYEGAHRRCVVFLPEYYSGDDARFRPDLCEIAFVKVELDKFHKDTELSHRDVLGTLMNLGLKRETIGDIVFEDDIIIVVKATNAGFIVENLTRIKHSAVKCHISDTPPNRASEEKVCETTTVASLRADAVVASVFNTSRALTADAIERGLVFINSAELSRPTATVKAGDTLSWRKKGRRKIVGILGESKKRRIII